MKKLVFLIILFIIAVSAYSTNPGLAVHQAKVDTTLQQALQESLSEAQPTLASMVGPALLRQATSNPLWQSIIGQQVTRDDYYVLSITKVHFEEKDYAVGIGGFDKVYIFPQFKTIVKSKLTPYIKKMMGAR